MTSCPRHFQALPQLSCRSVLLPAFPSTAPARAPRALCHRCQAGHAACSPAPCSAGGALARAAAPELFARHVFSKLSSGDELPQSHSGLRWWETGLPCSCSPCKRLVIRTESSLTCNRDGAKRPPDGSGFWIQTSSPEVKGCVLHYQPPESPSPPEICHAHFRPFRFYGQI